MDSETIKYWKTPLTIAEALEAFENMPDDILIPSEVFMEPPEIANDTDEDSGDEEEPNIDCFSKNQLNAGVEIRFENTDIEETDISNQPPQSFPHTILQQKWVAGNEEHCTLSANMYRFNFWKEAKIRPLTLSAESSPIDIFELFFPKTFVDAIVDCTKSYALKKKNQTIIIDADDIYSFFGALIVSGYCVLPRRRLYWALDEDVGNGLISKWIRRKTFEDIFTNIHFCNTDTIGSTDDRFVKIRPLINHLNNMFI